VDPLVCARACARALRHALRKGRRTLRRARATARQPRAMRPPLRASCGAAAPGALRKTTFNPEPQTPYPALFFAGGLTAPKQESSRRHISHAMPVYGWVDSPDPPRNLQNPTWGKRITHPSKAKFYSPSPDGNPGGLRLGAGSCLRGRGAHKGKGAPLQKSRADRRVDQAISNRRPTKHILINTMSYP
jgi:hypothetical protein